MNHCGVPAVSRADRGNIYTVSHVVEQTNVPEPVAETTPRASTKKQFLLRLWRVLRIALLAYVGILIVLLLLERSLIFIPTPYPAGYWEDKPAGVEDVQFTAADGTQLHGWYAAHEDP